MSLPYQQKHYQYSVGRFALVDYYYRDIWFVLDDEKVAHSIRQTFISKISFIVVDLTTFDNFNFDVNTVDSQVCFNWQVPPTIDCHATSYGLTTNIFTFTQTSNNFSSPLLINEPITTMLNFDTKKEIQDQIFLYQKILKKINENDINILNKQTNMHLNYFDIDQAGRNRFITEINHIFTIELTTVEIESCLHQLALQYLGTITPLPVKMLGILKKLVYE